jgi:large subunit ribosomal protein L18
VRATLIKNKRRERRAVRGAHIRRVSTLPRLCVSRSLKHISAQIIDDKAAGPRQSTTTAKTSRGPGRQDKTQRAVIGAEIAKKAIEGSVQAVVFDRGFARYHGRVKALADAARAGGLKF